MPFQRIVVNLRYWIFLLKYLAIALVHQKDWAQHPQMNKSEEVVVERWKEIHSLFTYLIFDNSALAARSLDLLTMDIDLFALTDIQFRVWLIRLYVSFRCSLALPKIYCHFLTFGFRVYLLVRSSITSRFISMSHKCHSCHTLSWLNIFYRTAL